MIRLAIIDDDDLIREGLAMILNQTPDLEVVAQGETGRDAVALARGGGVDVFLMDIRMPEMDGIEATRRIATEHEARVLILTTFDHDEYVFEALRAGASGFLLKRTPPERLVEAVRIVAEGESLLSPSVTRRLIEEFVDTTPVRKTDRISTLTERELEVLGGIARGLSNAELADELYIAANTVKTHVKRIFTKIGARDRAQAVVIAYEAGLVS